jgi:hypothetical protein
MKPQISLISSNTTGCHLWPRKVPASANCFHFQNTQMMSTKWLHSNSGLQSKNHLCPWKYLFYGVENVLLGVHTHKGVLSLVLLHSLPIYLEMGLRTSVSTGMTCPSLARSRINLPPAAVWVPVCCFFIFSSSFFAKNCSSRSLDLLALAGFIFFLIMVLLGAEGPATFSTPLLLAARNILTISNTLCSHSESTISDSLTGI